MQKITLKTAVKNSLVRRCKLKQEYSAANPLTRYFREAEANLLFLFQIRTLMINGVEAFMPPIQRSSAQGIRILFLGDC
jgi:hypothetical protein